MGGGGWGYLGGGGSVSSSVIPMNKADNITGFVADGLFGLYGSESKDELFVGLHRDFHWVSSTHAGISTQKKNRLKSATRK